MWENIIHKEFNSAAGKFAANNTKEVSKFSQTNLYKLAEGKVRVSFMSLYPMEKGFINIRNLTKLVTSKKGREEIVSTVTGYDLKKVQYLLSHNDYYEELKDEYQFLKNNQGVSPDGKWEFKLVNNFSEMQSFISKSENTIAGINTIEGGHAFFNQDMMLEKINKKEMKQQLMKNIIEVKEWEHPPFVVNLSHHFWNGLCGHAKSVNFVIGETLLNQKKGLDLGLQGLGIKALKEMLSNSNGKRIHIDTKHMSLKGRKEFYNWVRSYNYINKYDRIPIICTHSGFNGYKTMTGSLIKNDNPLKMAKSYFSNWSINNSDEELKIIHDTGGIVGLMLDKYKLGGGKFHKEVKTQTDEKLIKDAYMQLFWDQLFHAVKAIGSKTAWDIFAIGSDYDGSINHIDFYDGCDKLPNLKNDLYEYLSVKKYQQKLWYDYKPEELLDKIFRKNAIDFLERNFI
jgi:microsomal dipeptidase-like Zn-dependent dipeptidase